MPLVVTKPFVDGIGNIMNSLISGLSVDPDTKVTCNPYYSLGLYDTVLDSKYIYTDGPATLFGTFRLHVLKEEEDEQTHIQTEFADIQVCGRPEFSTKTAIDLNYDPSIICNRVRTRLLTLFRSIKFQPQIHEWVDKHTRTIDMASTLGISVRTWKASHERDIYRPYSADVYKDAIRKEITNGISHVVLSVDTPDVANEYVSFISQFPVSVILLKRSPEQNETQFAFVKMLVLSKCAVFIGNRISTFSELVFWFGDCKPKVVPLF
jgi:hypothetical protein